MRVAPAAGGHQREETARAARLRSAARGERLPLRACAYPCEFSGKLLIMEEALPRPRVLVCHPYFQ